MKLLPQKIKAFLYTHVDGGNNYTLFVCKQIQIKQSKAVKRFILLCSSFFLMKIFSWQVFLVPLFPSQQILLQRSAWGQCHPSSSTCIVWKCNERIQNTQK